MSTEQTAKRFIQCGHCRIISSKGLFIALLMKLRHCYNAYFRWIAGLLQRKVQGFLGHYQDPKERSRGRQARDSKMSVPGLSAFV